jgi:hypothetical protein
MDANGHIYSAENVPSEDAARLEGYLRGRAEADEVDRLRAEIEAAREEALRNAG